MKKFLLSFVFLSTFAQAQWYFVSDFTVSLAQASNSVLDSTIVSGVSPSSLIQSNIYTYDWHERLVKKNFYDVSANQHDLSTFAYDANDSLVKKTFASSLSVPSLTMETSMTRNVLKQAENDTVLYRSGSQYTLNNASIYNYDAGGNIVERVMDFYSGSWAPLNRRQYVRNSASKITNSLFQGWVNNAWENSNQSTTTYNGNNDMTDQIFQSWVTSSSSWKNSGRSRYAYTGSHLDTLTTYTWSNAWINSSRDTYSPAGALDSVTIENWNGTQWEGNVRYVRSWSQGKLTSVVVKQFSTTWENVHKFEYQYDSNGNHTTTNRSIYFTGGTSGWVLLIVTKHYYRPSTVGIAEHTLTNTKTYPVPTSGMLYFDTDLPINGGAVYTASGLEAIRFDGASVDLSLVTSGVYYVKLFMKDGNFKVVKAVRE